MKWDRETKNNLKHRIRELHNKGLDTDLILAELSGKFTGPTGAPLTANHVRALRLQAKIRMYKPHKRNARAKPKAAPIVRQRNSLPPSISLIMEDTQLTKEEKLRLLTAYLK